jgi:phage terminase large subunit GpA-like protein
MISPQSRRPLTRTKAPRICSAPGAMGLRPDPDLTVSAWADTHRILSPRGANEARACRTARTPRDHNTLSPQHSAQR